MRYWHQVGWFSYHFGVALTLECLVLAVVAGTGLWLADYRLSAVASGSMTPTFRIGDAVITRRVSVSHLRIGDIVSFASPENRTKIVSHRIVAFSPRSGLIVTKGDHLRQADTPIRTAAVRGQVVGVIPRLGHIIDRLHTPAGTFAFVCLPLVLLALHECYRFGKTQHMHHYQL